MRPKLRLSSVRLRLTLWSVLVLAVSLLAFGGLLRYQVQKDILREIDSDLDRRFFGEQRWPPPERSEAFRRPPGAGPPRSRPRRTQVRVFTLEGKPWPLFPGESREAAAALPWDPATFPLSARAGRKIHSTILAGDEPMRVLSLPLRTNGRVVAVLQAARPLDELNWAIERLTRTLLMFIPLSLLIAGGGGAFLTSRALRPVRSITQAAGHIGAQDLSRRLPVAGGDEFALLATTFNGMLERLERAFDQQRRFTADASHELRTPLAAIKAHTSLALLGERTPAQYRQTLQTVDRSADMAARIVQDLLLLARSDTGRLDLRVAPTRVFEVLRRAVETVEETPAPRLEIVSFDPTLTVAGDAHHLLRLFTNLLDNAIRHTPEGGAVRLSATADANTVSVVVEDTGEGIAVEHLPHLTERFYRVDDSRARASGGTGLGLAICQSITSAHRGSLTVESTLGEGTCVRVTLPRAPALLAEQIVDPVTARVAE